MEDPILWSRVSLHHLCIVWVELESMEVNRLLSHYVIFLISLVWVELESMEDKMFLDFIPIVCCRVSLSRTREYGRRLFACSQTLQSSLSLSRTREYGSDEIL